MSAAPRRLSSAPAPRPRRPTHALSSYRCSYRCLLSTFVASWKVIADYEKADAFVRSAHGEVPFVIVRPGHLLDSPGTGKYHTDTKIGIGKYHIGMKIARMDVASFLLRAASTAEFDNQAVQLWGAK